MPRRQYRFIDIGMVEDVLADQIKEHFRDYPDPAPVYQYRGGEHGRGLLESALAAPQQTFGGIYLHRTVLDKAAALWRSITMDHPFVDGNKRMGLLCCQVFLTMNRYIFIATEEEAVEFSVAIATGQPGTDVPQIARWLRLNTMTVEQLERLARFAEAEPRYLTMVVNSLREIDADEE